MRARLTSSYLHWRLNDDQIRILSKEKKIVRVPCYPHHNTPPPSPGGGTAIISVDARTDSLHISLVFNGVFGRAPRNASLIVELLPKRVLPPVNDTIHLPKISSVRRGWD